MTERKDARLTPTHYQVLLALAPVPNTGGVPGTTRSDATSMDEIEARVPGGRQAANELHEWGYVRTKTDYDHGWEWALTFKGMKALP